MELPTFELSLLISMAIILTSAFVALIVDYLRTANEQLREENAALRRRQRVGQRHEMKADPATRTSETPAAPAPAARAETGRLDDIVVGAEPKSPPAGRVVLVRPIRQPAEPPNPQPLPAPEPAAETGCIPFPSGWRDASAYASWMESDQAVSGLVIVLSVEESQQLRKASAKTSPSDCRSAVEQIVKASLREADVAFHPEQDRYILFFKGESGASAQRRESQFSERLWDFQLRSLGSLPVRLQWGAVEVEGQTSSSAVAAATRRMLEPRQGRRLFRISVAGVRKKAVVA